MLVRTLGYIDSPPPPTHFSKRLDTWGIPLAARFHVSDRGGCPDAVVLDLNMPEMRANSIVRDVRRLMASQQVIVLSGRGTSKEECVRMLGATEVIDKSATPHSRENPQAHHQTQSP